MWFLGPILKFITGGGASGLAEQFRLAQRDRLEAKNDSERLAAEERMERVATIMDAQTRGAGSWMPKLVRGCFAAPFILYNGKLIVWDKMLGWGTTDALSPYLEAVGWMVVGFYFLDASVGRVMRR